jgi:hypothetical protein
MHFDLTVKYTHISKCIKTQRTFFKIYEVWHVCFEVILFVSVHY